MHILTNTTETHLSFTAPDGTTYATAPNGGSCEVPDAHYKLLAESPAFQHHLENGLEDYHASEDADEQSEPGAGEKKKRGRKPKSETQTGESSEDGEDDGEDDAEPGAGE